MVKVLFGVLAVVIVLSVACADSRSTEGGENGPPALKVIATTTQIGDFAANVGGDRIALTVLLGPNQDAHDFQLEPSQIRAVNEARLVLRNGLGLDGFLDKSLEGSRASVVTLSAGIETRKGGHREDEHEEGDDHDEDEEHEGEDPHVWFSVANARRMVVNLRDAFIAEDGANGEYYRANATAYLSELDALEAEIRASVETVPQACRKLVTNHDVLGYYAAAYEFEVVGTVIPSTTSEAQASAADVVRIVRLIRDESVPAIFAEASINPGLVRQVGSEAGVTVVDDLYGDSLGPAGSDGDTYIKMMRSNTEKITSALRDCSAV